MSAETENWRRESPRVTFGSRKMRIPEDVFASALEHVGCDRHAAMFRGIEYRRSIDGACRMKRSGDGHLIFSMPDHAGLDDIMQALHYFLTYILAEQKQGGDSRHWEEDGRVVAIQKGAYTDGRAETVEEVEALRRDPDDVLRQGERLEHLVWIVLVKQNTVRSVTEVLQQEPK